MTWVPWRNADKPCSADPDCKEPRYASPNGFVDSACRSHKWERRSRSAMSAPCRIDDCDKPSMHAGYCSTTGWRHTQAVQRYGIIKARELDRIGIWRRQLAAYIRDFRGVPTWVYRTYRADGLLLYVGITVDVPDRMRGHAHDAAWWPVHDPGRTRTDWFPTREAADAAETEIIQTEAPLYNISKTLTPKVGRYVRTLPSPIAAGIVLVGAERVLL